jgi:adenine-specific DNA-methyltransferase
MANKTKLELTWIGKENRPRLEPRIFIEDPEKSYNFENLPSPLFSKEGNYSSLW